MKVWKEVLCESKNLLSLFSPHPVPHLFPCTSYQGELLLLLLISIFLFAWCVLISNVFHSSISVSSFFLCVCIGKVL